MQNVTKSFVVIQPDFCDVKKAFMFASSSGKFSKDGKKINESSFSPTELKQYMPVICCSCLLMLVTANESFAFKKTLYFVELVEELSSAFQMFYP